MQRSGHGVESIPANPIAYPAPEVVVQISDPETDRPMGIDELPTGQLTRVKTGYALADPSIVETMRNLYPHLKYPAGVSHYIQDINRITDPLGHVLSALYLLKNYLEELRNPNNNNLNT